MTTYSYSIQNNFPNHLLASDRLKLEIANSAIVIALDHISTIGDDCFILFKDILSNSDKIILDNLIAVHSGITLPENIINSVKLSASDGHLLKVNEDYMLMNVSQPRTGSETIYSTHNFCDKVSWFSDSIRVNNKVLTSSDGYRWETGDTYIVDMISGRVQDDDGLVEEQMIFNPSDPHGYQVVLTVDGYAKTIREPFFTSGGDYEVFWEDGYILSFDNWTDKTVVASYSKVNSSIFILKPLPGTILDIEAAEADFSIDAEMRDTIEYSIWGYASIFAPQLGLPNGTKIPLTVGKYKRFSQLLNEAIGTYPLIEVHNNIELANLSLREFRRQSRNIKSKIQSIPFRYATTRSLRDSLGLELHVSLLNNIEFGGFLGSLTFYCTSKAE